MALPNLLFIDTNIWLDCYRARNDIGLQLLKRAEKVSEQIIITYQLESEFKKNRQTVIYESWRELKGPTTISRPGIFADAKAALVMARNLKEAEKRVKHLRARLIKALDNPAQHDPVYQVCQRLFQKTDDLTLTRDNPLRRRIRRAAYRRLLHGCPPGKRGDTSYGDAFNWEWMVHCAREKKMGLVIVSRDSDYGVTIEDKAYVNDHLRHEFSDRVSRKRTLALYPSLANALKSFDVPVSEKEEEAEKELLSVPTVPSMAAIYGETLDPNVYGKVPYANRAFSQGFINSLVDRIDWEALNKAQANWSARLSQVDWEALNNAQANWKTLSQVDWEALKKYSEKPTAATEKPQTQKATDEKKDEPK